MHWRITRTSISYQMKAQGATTLRVKGFAGYERIVVSIDGKQLETIRLNQQGQAEIKLPAACQNETATITLAAESGRQTPRIHEVRLCK